MVEAAILLPLLLLLTFAVFDFAGVFTVYLALENGVSQAARYGVTGNQMPDPSNPAATLSRDDSIKTAMRQATPTLTLPDAAFTFSHIPSGGAAWVAGSGGPSDIERVSVQYTWNIITPLIRPFFPGGQITIQVQSAMKDESRFN